MLIAQDQKIKELFESPIVQENLPARVSLYPWEGTKGCLGWDWTKIDRTWELKECSELPGAGGCRIDVFRGACYGDAEWGCWAPGTASSPSHCRGRGYAGACSYKEYGKVLGEEDVAECNADCIEKCAEKETNWGACYVNDKAGLRKGKQCLCIEQGNNGGAPNRYLKNGCLSTPVGLTDRLYDGLCQLPGKQFVPLQELSSRAAIARRPAAKRISSITRTTTTMDLSLLDSEECQCDETGTVNGRHIGRRGCAFHISRSHGKFCYISGDGKCPGAKFSAKHNTYWRKC